MGPAELRNSLISESPSKTPCDVRDIFLYLNPVYPGQHLSHLLLTSYLTSIISVHYQDVLVQSTKSHHGECLYHSRTHYDFKDWTYYKIRMLLHCMQKESYISMWRIKLCNQAIS